MFRIAHFADLHLDATFKWAPAEYARRRRAGLRQTLKNILREAQERHVQAVLCAGDLFEHDRITPDTEEFLRESFRGVAPLPVFIAPGNHDWWGVASPYRRLDWSQNVHVFSTSALGAVELAPGLRLWGGAHKRPVGTANFLEGFQVDGGPNDVHLALFHGSHEGSLHFQGDKNPHAPFREGEIPASGLSHAFVGHYHKANGAQYFTYPGNPDPLAFGEDGGRGLVIAEIGPDGTVSRETICVATSHAQDVVVDVSGFTNRDDILAHVRETVSGPADCVRVTLTGDLEPSVDLKESDVVECLGHKEAVMVRRGDLRVAYDVDAIALEPSVRGQFVQDVRDAQLDEEEKRRIITIGLRALEGREDLEVF